MKTEVQEPIFICTTKVKFVEIKKLKNADCLFTYHKMVERIATG